MENKNKTQKTNKVERPIWKDVSKEISFAFVKAALITTLAYPFLYAFTDWNARRHEAYRQQHPKPSATEVYALKHKWHDMNTGGVGIQNLEHDLKENHDGNSSIEQGKEGSLIYKANDGCKFMLTPINLYRGLPLPIKGIPSNFYPYHKIAN